MARHETRGPRSRTERDERQPRVYGQRDERRLDSGYRAYATDEQRSQAGCIGVRMPANLWRTALDPPAPQEQNRGSGAGG